MNILGIDIGTTTVTALVLNTDTKTAKSVTLKNDSFIDGRSFEKLQSPEIIIDTVKKAVKDVTAGIKIESVGVTGQMHGILYLDKNNTPCSPLMIWQDGRGNEIYKDNITYAEYLTKETGIKSASGFGLTTHFYNVVNNEVPKDAVKLTTIHDYLVSVLTGSDVVTHSSDGASLGFYDLVKNEFSREALKKVGISFDMLPKVIKTTSVAGTTNCNFLPDGIPVSVAIGDNQASFLGSVAERESVLVNVGTGSQVSFITKEVKELSNGEIRPLTDDDYIFVGSSLCGGRAYAILKNFFTLCADFLGGNSDDLYNRMNSLSRDVFDLENPLNVSCEFCGTRENPNKRGFIENISEDNFTPTHLICGFLKGVSKELKDMFDSADILLDFEPKELVCSGNGLRKSGVWRKIFENDFSLKSTLPKHSEEAAVGACIFSSVASGIYINIKDAQNSLLR